MLKSNSISKSVIWLLVGKFLLQGMAFLTMPIFTRILSPADYGFASLYLSWLSIFSLLEGLQVAGTIGNARLEFGEEKLPQYLSSIMSVAFLSFVVILFFVFIFRGYLSQIIELPESLLIIVVIHSFFLFVLNFEITRFDQLKKVEKSTLLSFSQTAITTLLSLFLIINISSNKATAKILGQAIPTILMGIIILFLIYKRGGKLWDSAYIKFCLSFSLPLIFHGVGHLIFNQSDRIMLKNMHGDEILGVYSVAFSLCSVLTIIFNSLNVAWVPFYFDYKKVENSKEIISHSKRYIKFFTLLSIGFLLLYTDVYKLMAPPEYYSGITIIPLFVLSNYFSFMYLFPVNFEFFKKKTKIIPFATFIAAAINIIINLILIPKYGILGAAIGTVLAHVLLYIFHEIVARQIGKNEYEYKKSGIFIVPIITMVIICLIFLLFSDIVFWFRWLIAIIIAIQMIKDIYINKSIF